MKRRDFSLGLASSAVAAALRASRARAHEHGASHEAARGLGTGVAVGPDGSIWIAATDAAGRLFVQRRPSVDAPWESPRVLGTGTDAIATDGESRPALAIAPDGRAIVIAYTRPLPKPYTGEVRLVRSHDGGRSFTAPVTVHDDRQIITHRFASVIFDRRGDLYVVWVDKRDLEGHQSTRSAGPAAYAGAALYGKVSRDGGRTFGPDLKLADHSCECCRIALALSRDGAAVALWRHVFPGNVRDHAFAPLAALGSGREPVRSTEDGWVVSACPHHGPSLACAAGGGYHAVWYGVRAGEAGVRIGRLNPDGSPAGAPREIPDAGAEHADLVTRDQEVAVVWRSFDGERTRLVAWRSADDGASFDAPREIAHARGACDAPRLVVAGDAIVAVWRTAAQMGVYRV